MPQQLHCGWVRAAIPKWRVRPIEESLNGCVQSPHQQRGSRDSGGQCSGFGASGNVLLSAQPWEI